MLSRIGITKIKHLKFNFSFSVMPKPVPERLSRHINPPPFLDPSLSQHTEMLQKLVKPQLDVQQLEEWTSSYRGIFTLHFTDQIKSMEKWIFPRV